jgi:hypothetical protein
VTRSEDAQVKEVASAAGATVSATNSTRKTACVRTPTILETKREEAN